MTERAKKLLLLYYKQSRKIRRVSGLPPLTFKAKKAGTLKNYRIYGNTETKTRSYSGSAPLSFPIEDGAVSNYRVYGNTVNGESVGDKTVNILPLSRTPITEIHGDFLCEYDGLGTITLTTDKDNATTDGEFVIPLIQDFTIPVSIGQGGTGCLQINNDCYGSSLGNISFVYNSTAIDTWSLNALNRIHSSYSVLGNKIVNQIAIYIARSISYRKITIRPAFVENVTEQAPFEPYGFKIPITNNSENANIYLDEPLRKVGDEAEYVDYAEQKRYNADGTNEDVTLPALPAQSSSNSLSVGTTVQPSSVAVDVGEIVSCGDRTANLFDENSLIGTSWYFDDEHYLVAVSQTSDNRPWGYNYSQFFITLQPGSYTFKIDGVATSNPYAMIAIYDGNSSLFSKLLTNISSLSTQITLSSITTLGFMIKIYDGKFRLSLTKSTTEPSEFEPYGYKIPVTLTAGNAETTDIYLDTPLAKSGNNADYIDYATQKRHNSDGTESTVTLPEIAVTAGTNTLTVGTEVQPSSVEIKGRIKAAGGD